MTQRDLADEASDPTTDPERLAELLNSPMTQVARLAKSNPSLPSALHRSLLEAGSIWAWMNPQTPFTLLIDGTTDELLHGAQKAVGWVWSPTLAFDPSVLHAALAPVLDPWWASTDEADEMFLLLHRWSMLHFASHETPSFELGLRWLEGEPLPNLVAGDMVREAIHHLRTWKEQPEASQFLDAAKKKAINAKNLLSSESITNVYGIVNQRLFRELHVTEAAVELTSLAVPWGATGRAASGLALAMIVARARTHAVALVDEADARRGWAWEREPEDDPVSWEDIERFKQEAKRQLAKEIRAVQPTFPWVSTPSERWVDDGLDDEELPF